MRKQANKRTENMPRVEREKCGIKSHTIPLLLYANTINVTIINCCYLFHNNSAHYYCYNLLSHLSDIPVAVQIGCIHGCAQSSNWMQSIHQFALRSYKFHNFSSSKQLRFNFAWIIRPWHFHCLRPNRDGCNKFGTIACSLFEKDAKCNWAINHFFLFERYDSTKVSAKMRHTIDCTLLRSITVKWTVFSTCRTGHAVRTQSVLFYSSIHNSSNDGTDSQPNGYLIVNHSGLIEKKTVHKTQWKILFMELNSSYEKRENSSMHYKP